MAFMTRFLFRFSVLAVTLVSSGDLVCAAELHPKHDIVIYGSTSAGIAAAMRSPS